MADSLRQFMEQCRSRIDESLLGVFPAQSHVSPRLLEAMQYSVFNGGKRVRPTLVYAACHALGGDVEKATPAACAVELIHAYSLVHDDLPAMDDDDLRRGKPACHKAYDEATAILVGDTLQSLAFEVLTSQTLWPDDLSDRVRVQLVNTLSHASGLAGMAGGQALDQLAVGSVLSQQQLELMHTHKTGALICASVKMGALCAREVDEEELASLEHYSRAIGLAFQVRDDILDVISDTETLGKYQGADIALDKPTFVSLLGLEQARAYAQELCHSATSALYGFGDTADYLRRIADYIIRRSY